MEYGNTRKMGNAYQQLLCLGNLYGRETPETNAEVNSIKLVVGEIQCESLDWIILG
jgi:hypothetical protein